MLENVILIFEEIVIPVLTILTSWSVISFIIIMAFYPAFSKMIHRIANRQHKDRGKGRED